MKTLASLLAAVLLAPASAFSFAHFWDIQEVYTNADGSVQFIEFFENTGGGEIFLSAAAPLRFELSQATVNSLAFNNTTATDGSGDLSGSTFNKTFLVATANFQSLYGFAPDYIIPANFLASGVNRTLDYPSGPDEVSLQLLPTNGIMSLNGQSGNNSPTAVSINALATPQNFAGQSVVIPEPGTAGLFALGGVLASLVFARRRSS